MSDISDLEAALGYRFNDPHLLTTALTHSSWSHEHRCDPKTNNERLEFLGDAVLSLCISTHLFNHPSDFPEGKLSKLRAAIVCEETLCEVAKNLSLGDYLRLGKGETRTQGSMKASNLSNAVEAILGAIYLDRDFQTAFAIASQWLAPYLSQALEGQLIYDYKTTLIEIIQGWGVQHQIVFKQTHQEGPPHHPIFYVEVLIDQKVYGRGNGNSKKAAEQAAAKATLSML